MGGTFAFVLSAAAYRNTTSPLERENTKINYNKPPSRILAKGGLNFLVLKIYKQDAWFKKDKETKG